MLEFCFYLFRGIFTLRFRISFTKESLPTSLTESSTVSKVLDQSKVVQGHAVIF